MRTFAIAIAAFAITALSAYAGTNGEVRVRFPIGDGRTSVTEVIERDGRVSSAVTNVTSGLPKNEFGVIYCDEFVANAIITARVRKAKNVAVSASAAKMDAASLKTEDEETRKRQEAWERMQRTFENNKKRREKMRKDKEEGGAK